MTLTNIRTKRFNAPSTIGGFLVSFCVVAVLGSGAAFAADGGKAQAEPVVAHDHGEDPDAAALAERFVQENRDPETLADHLAAHRAEAAEVFEQARAQHEALMARSTRLEEALRHGDRAKINDALQSFSDDSVKCEKCGRWAYEWNYMMNGVEAIIASCKTDPSCPYAKAQDSQ